MKNTTQFILDRFAIGLSVLCAIHCLFVPVLLLLFPSVIATLQLDNHFFHELLVWLVIPTSIVAVFLGCKRHKNVAVLTLAGIGMLSLVATAMFGHAVLGEVGEKIATLFAASILAYAHWRNYVMCRTDSCEHE